MSSSTHVALTFYSFLLHLLSPPLLFLVCFLLFSSWYHKELEQSVHKYQYHYVHRWQRCTGTKVFYLFPNPVIPVLWGSGQLWICHVSLLPFTGWLWLNLPLFTTLSSAGSSSLLCFGPESQLPYHTVFSDLEMESAHEWHSTWEARTMSKDFETTLLLVSSIPDPRSRETQYSILITVLTLSDKAIWLTLNNRKQLCPGNCCVCPESCSRWFTME